MNGQQTFDSDEEGKSSVDAEQPEFGGEDAQQADNSHRPLSARMGQPRKLNPNRSMPSGSPGTSRRRRTGVVTARPPGLTIDATSNERLVEAGSVLSPGSPSLLKMVLSPVDKIQGTPRRNMGERPVRMSEVTPPTVSSLEDTKHLSGSLPNLIDLDGEDPFVVRASIPQSAEEVVRADLPRGSELFKSTMTRMQSREEEVTQDLSLESASVKANNAGSSKWGFKSKEAQSIYSRVFPSKPHPARRSVVERSALNQAANLVGSPRPRTYSDVSTTRRRLTKSVSEPPGHGLDSKGLERPLSGLVRGEAKPQMGRSISQIDGGLASLNPRNPVHRALDSSSVTSSMLSPRMPRRQMSKPARIAIET